MRMYHFSNTREGGKDGKEDSYINYGVTMQDLQYLLDSNSLTTGERLLAMMVQEQRTTNDILAELVASLHEISASDEDEQAIDLEGNVAGGKRDTSQSLG